MRPLKYGALVGAVSTIIIAGSALASPPSLVVVDGDSTSTDHPFTALTSGGITFSANSIPMSCTSVSAAGDVHGGPVNPANIASIDSTVWSGCLGPLNASMSVTMLPGSWTVVGVTGETSGGSDLISGYVDNVSAHVESNEWWFPCEFDVVGLATASFDEEVLRSAGPPAVYGQDLIVNEVGDTGNLELDNVVGCDFLLNDGDRANFSGTFNVNVTGAVSSKPINVQ